MVLGELPASSGGKHVAVLRQRGEGAPIEAGVVRPLKEGEPINGELVTLKPTSEDARLCDVEVHHDARPKTKTHAGPSRVATDEYREGWEQIFGRERPKELN